MIQDGKPAPWPPFPFPIPPGPVFLPPPLPAAPALPAPVDAAGVPVETDEETPPDDERPATTTAPVLPPPVAAQAQATALPPPVAPAAPPAAPDKLPRIGQREYLRELPFEEIQPRETLAPIEYPDKATPEQKAAIDNLNAERQQIADAGRRAEIEQSLRTATASANAALAQDLQRERLGQLEAEQERRARQMRRREEVEAGVDQDYEELRRLAKEKLPDMSTNDKIALVAVAAAGAINAALNGIQPGQATNTALQQIVNRRSEERARQITGLREATAAGEAQLGMLDTATERSDYVQSLAKAELYEEVATQADTMAARATSNEERVRLAYAARDARANAAQQIESAKQQQREFQLKLSKEQREIDEAKRKADLEARELGLRQQDLAERRAERLQKAAAEKEEREARLGKIRQEMRLDTEGRTVLSPAGGQKLTYRSQSDAQDIATKAGAAKNMVETLDALMAKRNQHGMEWSRWLQTDEAQEMLALYGDLFFDMKEYKDLGVISGSDEDLIDRVLGGDPTAIKAFTAGLAITRSQTVKGINNLMKSRLVIPEERETFTPWNPPAPTFDFTPDPEQAATTLRTGSVEDARGAAQEIVAAAKRENPDNWAESAFRQLEAHKLELQAQRDGTSGDERKAIDQKIHAVRKALDQPEAELGRQRAHQIGLDVSKQATAERQKVDALRTSLRGIIGIKRSDVSDNPYMDAIRLYQSGDAKQREAVLESLRESGYTDLRTFLDRAGGAE